MEAIAFLPEKMTLLGQRIRSWSEQKGFGTEQCRSGCQQFLKRRQRRQAIGKQRGWFADWEFSIPQERPKSFPRFSFVELPRFGLMGRNFL